LCLKSSSVDELALGGILGATSEHFRISNCRHEPRTVFALKHF
jgi:hypothetical protein